MDETVDDVIQDVQKLAELGDADAQFKLGYMYAKGLVLSVDRGAAARWLGKAAEQGHAGAIYELQALTEPVGA
ncbi:MAG: hypothetical protein H7838_06105 [Magnetococcus sp. DMHC-8]